MKKFWNAFINFCLVIVGLRLAFLGIYSLIHFNTNFSFPENTSSEFRILGVAPSGFKHGYNAAERFGYIIGYFIRIPVAIAILSLFFERVFKKSKSK